MLEVEKLNKRLWLAGASTYPPASTTAYEQTSCRGMKQAKLRWALGVLLLCMNMSLWAQQSTLVLQGRVLSAQEEPLPGAVVTVKRTNKGAIADTRGRFEIGAVPRRDSLQLSVSLAGYKLFRYTVLPEAGQQTIELPNFRLQPISTEEIVVTGRVEQEANRMVTSMTTLEGEALDKIAGSSVSSPLRLVPGFSSNGQPSLRGSSGYTYGAGSRVLLLMNGLPMLTPNRSSTDFEMIPTENVERIEVMKGASSVLYGSGALGGVINVILREPTEEPLTSVRLRTFIYDSPANDSADWDGRSSATAYSTHLYHGQKVGNYSLTLMGDIIRSSGRRQEQYSDKFRYFMRHKWEPDFLPGLAIGLDLQAYHERSAGSLSWAGYPVGALQTPDEFYSQSVSDKAFIDPHITYFTPNGKNRIQYRGRTYLSLDAVSSGQSGENNTYFNELQYTRYFSDDVQLVAGVSHLQNRIGQSSTFGDAKSDQLAAFGQLTAQLTPRLYISAGARYQYEVMVGDTARRSEDKNQFPTISAVTMANPIFTGGVNYELFKEFFLRASAGQAVRSPSIAERFTATEVSGVLNVEPNEDISLEEGWTAEVGMRRSFGGNRNRRLTGYVDLAAFTMQYRNMVEFYVDPQRLIATGLPVFRAQNISEANITGAELTADLHYRHRENAGLRFNGGITYTEPLNPNGNPAWNGDDSLVVIEAAALNALLGNIDDPEDFPQDNPSILKYRSKWMVRSAFDLYINNFTFTNLYRYDSRIENVDLVFLLPSFFPGNKKFREQNPNGWHVFDWIFSYTFRGGRTQSTFSFLVSNVFNAEYAARPGSLSGQRNFGLQYKLTL